jgi:gliding motility-associated-like protein
MKKFLALFLLVFLSFTIKAYSQAGTCETADPFCTGTTITFPAYGDGTGSGSGPQAQTGPNYDCLMTTPSPAWYYLRIATAGSINIHMTNDMSQDIDYCCWGPFSSLSGVCSQLNSSTDCSYSTAAIEDCSIPNAQVGQYYILVITNYANNPCNITFSQTSGNGATDCSILAPPITNNGPLCEGDNLDFTVVNPTPNATYNWTGPNGFTSNQMNPSIPNATVAASGVYSMTITLNGQTSAPVTTTVVVNPIPVTTASASPTTICVGSQSVLTAGGADTYSWSGGSISGSAANPVAVSPATTTTYTVTGTSSGCSSTASVTVTVGNNLTLSVNPPSASMCSGNSVSLVASGATTYSWTPAADLNIATGDSVVATPITTTTYTVNGSDALGCSGVATVTVTIISNITVGVTPQNAVICNSQSVEITASGASTYSWDPPMGLSSATGSPVTASPMLTTIYTVTGNTSGCTGTATVLVTVNPLPVINFTSDISSGCEPLKVQFNMDSMPMMPATVLWDFGDPNSGTTNHAHTTNPAHIFQYPGTYSITLNVDMGGGCGGSLYIPNMITVYPKPIASFTATPDNPWMLDPTVWFTDGSTLADRWYWDFDETDPLINNSDNPNPIHTYAEDTATYHVTLAVFTIHGCTDTARHTIKVQPNVSFYAPNAFSPNGDGKNPKFNFYGEGINLETFNARIFDRWGTLVFFSQDFYEGWDGSLNGTTAGSQGVYVWYVTFKDVKGKDHKYKGSVTLFR